MVGYPYRLFIKHMVSMRGAGHKNGIKSAYLHLITDEMASVFSKPHLEENQFPMAPHNRSPPGCHGAVSTWVRPQPSGASPPSVPSSGPTLCTIHRGRAALHAVLRGGRGRAATWTTRPAPRPGTDRQRIGRRRVGRDRAATRTDAQGRSGGGLDDGASAGTGRAGRSGDADGATSRDGAAAAA